MEVLQHRELRTPTSIPMNEGDQGLVRWSDLSAYEGQEFPPWRNSVAGSTGHKATVSKSSSRW